MSQSNYIAAAIALAFIVYITMKGSISKYIEILTGGAGFQQDTASAGNAPQQTADANGTTPAAPAENASGKPDDTKAPEPLSLLQQVMKADGPANDILGTVKLFNIG